MRSKNQAFSDFTSGSGDDFIERYYPPGRGRVKSRKREFLRNAAGRIGKTVDIPEILRKIRAAGHFEPFGYLARNPDVAAAGADPFCHYLTHGWKEGRDPAPGFSVDFYLGTNPDVEKAAVEPLFHFHSVGQSEGRAVFPWAMPSGGDESISDEFRTERPLRILFLVESAEGIENRSDRVIRFFDALPDGFYRKLVLSLASKRAACVAARTADILWVDGLGWSSKLQEIVDGARGNGALVHFHCEVDSRNNASSVDWADPQHPFVQTFLHCDQATVEGPEEARLPRRYRVPVFLLPEDRSSAGGSIRTSRDQSAIEDVAFGSRGSHFFSLALRRILRAGRARREDLMGDRLRWVLDPPTGISVPADPAWSEVFAARNHERAEVCLVIPLYNYGDQLMGALESVEEQTLADLDLIVVDDSSTDDSVRVATRWLADHAERFGRVRLLVHRENARLGAARNTGVRASETEFFFPLDPDNRLLPDCLEKCLSLIRHYGCAMTFPDLIQEGEGRTVLQGFEWDPARLVNGNHIDAMALIRKEVWSFLGGYSVADELFGWEDFDLWCKMVERGFEGRRVREKLAVYRVHGRSLLESVTDRPGFGVELRRKMGEMHPWLDLE